jgi:alpha-beta hydrolase superfamily lysophospholipase
VSTPALVREHLFAPNTPDELVTRSASLVQRESLRALYLDCAFLNLPKPERVKTPVLTLGAEHDGIISQDEVHATARSYGTEAEIFSEMGHNMMMEPGWRDVAERIAAWLNTKLTPPRN